MHEHALGQLAASNTFPNLRLLDLRGNDLGESHMRELFGRQTGLMGRIEHVLLDDNPIGARGLIWLLRRADPSSLRGLGLARCQVTTGLVSMLARTRELDSLERLRISDNPLSHGLADLARSSNLPSLRSLEVRSLRADFHTLIALATSASLTSLVELSVDAAQVETLQARALSPRLVHAEPITWPRSLDRLGVTPRESRP